MNSILENIDTFAEKLLKPLQRFPFASLSAFIFTLFMVLDVIYSHKLQSSQFMEKITFVFALAFFFFLALRLMKKWWLPIVGAVLVMAYYFYIPDSLNEYMRDKEAMTIVPLMFMFLLFFVFISPFLYQKSSNRAFFEWFKAFIYQFLLSVGLGLLLFIVLTTGFKIIEVLFNFHLEYYYDIILGLISFSLVSVHFFLSRLPKEPAQIEPKEYNGVENIFVKYILTTIFIVYFFIIYIYTGKMIFLSEYSNGFFFWNVIAFSVLAILTYIFWTPLWNEKNQKYKKVIWIAIILQMILLFIALSFRVESYGWTLARVILISFSILLFSFSLYALVKNEFSYKIFFISVPLLIVLNIIFAPIISKISQQNRLGTLLANHSSFSNDSNISLRYNISSKIAYLYNYYGTDALFPILPTIVTEYENKNNHLESDCSTNINEAFPVYATEKLGFKYIDEWAWKNHLRESKQGINRFKNFYTREDIFENGLDVKEYDLLMRFDYAKSDGFLLKEKSCSPLTKGVIINSHKFSIETESNMVILKESQKEIARVKLDRFIHKILRKKIPNQELANPLYFRNDFTKNDFTYLFENSKIRVKLLFSEFTFSMKDDVQSYRGVLMVGEK